MLQRTFFIVPILYFCTSIGGAGPRVSLESLLRGLPGSEITQEYKKSTPDLPKVHEWLKVSQKMLSEFRERVTNSTPFVRGEIEQEKVLNSLTLFLQLSILKCRMEVLEKKDKSCADEVPLWFRFATDFAYEEASLIGLRYSILIRSLWLDELESQAKKDAVFLASTQDWIWSMRTAWPVDRVMLEEGRKVLKPAGVRVVEKIMKEFQKNPYQTAEQMLKKVSGGKAADLEFIKKIWRAEDLDAMKTEMNRMNTLRVRAAQARFFQSQNKKAANYEELLSAKLITATPTDYFTGRPLGFP